MAKKGFIKIPKRLFDTKWWNRKRVYSESDAFIYLYYRADCEKELSVSRRSLANEWIWDDTRVMRFLYRLEKDGYLTVEKSISGTTIKILDSGASAPQPAPPTAPPIAPPKVANTEGLNDVGAPPSAPPSAPQPAPLSHAYKNDNIIISCLNEDYKTKENSSITTAVKESEILAEVRQFFNKTVENCLIPKVRSITGERKSMLLARIREYSLEEVYEAFTKAASSNFLNGGGNRGFVADFTWIIRPNNFPKVLEGNYDNRNSNGTNRTNNSTEQTVIAAAEAISELLADNR